jgi:hypothetical protein
MRHARRCRPVKLGRIVVGFGAHRCPALRTHSRICFRSAERAGASAAPESRGGTAGRTGWSPQTRRSSRAASAWILHTWPKQARTEPVGWRAGRPKPLQPDSSEQTPTTSTRMCWAKAASRRGRRHQCRSSDECTCLMSRLPHPMEPVQSAPAKSSVALTSDPTRSLGSRSGPAQGPSATRESESERLSSIDPIRRQCTGRWPINWRTRPALCVRRRFQRPKRTVLRSMRMGEKRFASRITMFSFVITDASLWYCAGPPISWRG